PGGAGARAVIDSERTGSPSPLEIGATDQYQPDPGCEKRRSPRLGEPESSPSSPIPTEPIRLNRWAESTLSKPRSLTCRNSATITVAMITRAMTAQIEDSATTRNVSDRSHVAMRILSQFCSLSSLLTGIRFAHPVSHAAHGLDQVHAQLLAQTTHEHLDRIGIAVEILVVEMLDQFGAGDDGSPVMHQIGEQPV